MKRRAIFKQIKSNCINIAALQETYLNESENKNLERELNGTIHFSNGVGRSKGLLTYFDNLIDRSDIKCLFKSDR